MTPREERGLVIAAMCRLNRTDDGTWLVPSQSKNAEQSHYRVNVEAKTCTCLDHKEGGYTCKHYYAATYVQQRDVLPDGTMIETETITFTKKKVYKQDWRAYNLAQSTEKHRFQELLFDLTRGIQEPDEAPGKRGRKPHTVKDSIFSMVYKVYNTMSSRRFTCDLKDAHARGYLGREISGLMVNLFMETPTFAPVLQALIAHSALPLNVIEKDFAIDSSGFATSRFERWYDQKYGVTRQRCIWTKAHIACGVKTNIITAARVLNKDSADSPQFVPLVKQTRKGFEIGEVSADKAYCSLENFKAVANAGGTGFLMFKDNATGAAGGKYAKMFHYFQFKQEEFLQHYHKRSNVESTFSAVKRKFGDSLRSKCDYAMTNETYCKLLAHNICVLVQEQCELGIEPIFWDKEEREGKAVLPMSPA